MVDEEGLAVETGMRPTRGRLGEVLEISKLVMPLKNVEQIGICEKLTGAKMGANVAEEYKIEVERGKLTVHTAGEKDILGKVYAAVDNSVTEEDARDSVEEGLITSSVDEVLGTCMVETGSYDVDFGGE